MWARAVLVASLALAFGCATAPRGPERLGITPEGLLAGAPLGGGLDPLATHGELLAMSPAMRDFLDRHVSRVVGDRPRLRELARVILNEDLFGLEYDETTRTAGETFRDRRGNCLSFSSMFVAMARQLGLDAHYQEVDTPPDWSLRDGTLVLNRHVNVVVDLGLHGEHVVDFNLDDFRTSYDRRRITDARALAHHHNNVAVERMQAGDRATALYHFRQAATSDPTFSPSWTNLGTLYLQNGHPAHAEAAYLHALLADERDLVAMSSLAGLYQRRGDDKLARRYRKRVTAHRNRNPYYRYRRAQEAFAAGDHDAAIDHLDFAIRKKHNEDRFYFLLARIHFEEGDEEAARQWLVRAEEVAATDASKRRYASKIELLLGAPPADQLPLRRH